MYLFYLHAKIDAKGSFNFAAFDALLNDPFASF
jgi:hypothetical protein